MVNPILGVDPQTVEITEALENESNPAAPEQQAPPAQAEAQTQASEEVPVIKTPQLTPQQLFEMQEKARLYDTINSDPEISAYVLSQVEKKLRGQPTTPAQQVKPENAEIARMRQEMEQTKQEMQRYLAEQTIREFASKTPDFNNYKQEMGELLRRHPTLTLPEAYEFAKRSKAPVAAPKPAAQKAALQTSEVRNTPPASTSDDDDPSYDRIVQRINDPKATKSFKEVLDLATKAALKKTRS